MLQLYSILFLHLYTAIDRVHIQRDNMPQMIRSKQDIDMRVVALSSLQTPVSISR